MSKNYRPVTIVSEDRLGRVGTEGWAVLTAGMIRGRVAELEAADWAVQEVQVGEAQESLDYTEWGTAITRPDPTLVELLQKQKNYIEELRQAVQYAVDQIDQIASRERIEKVYKRMKEVLGSKARCAGAIPQLLTKPAHKAFVEGSND